MEIEKKFMITRMPKGLDQFESKHIEQGYLCSDPVIRIRKSNEIYYMTYKARKMKENQKALCCDEVEVPLSKEAFEHLKEKVDNNLIKKIRYIIPLSNNLKAELDVFLDKLDGLTMVEVEFPDEEMVASFIAPDWFGKEVTFDKRFTNNYLATIDNISQL